MEQVKTALRRMHGHTVDMRMLRSTIGLIAGVDVDELGTDEQLQVMLSVSMGDVTKEQLQKLTDADDAGWAVWHWHRGHASCA